MNWQKIVESLIIIVPLFSLFGILAFLEWFFGYRKKGVKRAKDKRTPEEIRKSFKEWGRK